METLIFNNIYDWYKLEESVRHAIWEKNEPFLIKEKSLDWLNLQCYIAVLWSDPWINYCQPYGLLYFPKIFGGSYDEINRKGVPRYNGKKWFGVRVFSPDDWDFDLDFDLDNYSLKDAQEKYDTLVKITRDYLSTSPSHPQELFAAIKGDMLKKYPSLKTSGF